MPKIKAWMYLLLSPIPASASDDSLQSPQLHSPSPGALCTGHQLHYFRLGPRLAQEWKTHLSCVPVTWLPLEIQSNIDSHPSFELVSEPDLPCKWFKALEWAWPRNYSSSAGSSYWILTYTMLLHNYMESLFDVMTHLYLKIWFAVTSMAATAH